MDLHEVRWRGMVCESAGQTIRLDVPSDMPVFDETPDRPAFARAPEAAWPAVLEKAVAGVDQAWTSERGADWDADWSRMKQARNAELEARGESPLPDGPTPTGYARLNQGTTARDRAELLTQLTGEPAEVRPFPDGPSGDASLIAELEQRLTDDKPVLAGTRALRETEAHLPHGLYPSHVYAVTNVEDGKVQLHNPWNRLHPEPLTAAEFRDCFGTKDRHGRTRGTYTTLQ